MKSRPEQLHAHLEERIRFFSEIGADFLSFSSPYQELKAEILDCQKCPLAKTRIRSVPGEGDIKSDLLFVGEGPGRDEDVQGRPFVGRAGQLLTKIINAMNFKREQVYITNIIKCRPPENRDPNQEEIEVCKPYLFRQLEIIRPRVIVTLGNVPTRFFLDTKQGITAMRGEFWDYGLIKVMPTFHPSYLIRNEGNRALKKMVWEDMKKVMAFLGKK